MGTRAASGMIALAGVCGCVLFAGCAGGGGEPGDSTQPVEDARVVDDSSTHVTDSGPSNDGGGGDGDGDGHADDAAETTKDVADTSTKPTDAVCFFSDADYAGKSFCVGEGSANTTPDWNDVISSVRVSPGYRVELYADAGAAGRALALIADEPRLGGCFFNDAASSYRVDVDMPSKFQSVNFLRKVSGCKIVAGQHNDEKGSSPHYYTDIVRSITGQDPALWSGEFGFSGDTAARWDVTHEAEAQWKKGAIINLMFHACPPTQGSSCAWDGGVKSKLSVDQWKDLLADGGTLNKAWKARLDELVPFFTELEAKKVEVLFRPHHEMNQSVFWWGGNVIPKGTSRLFQLTHDYLVVTKGFTHIGFVWDVQNLSTDYSDYDPGDTYWDVSAIDYYGGASADSAYSGTGYYDALLPLTHGKPMAIGETFFLPPTSVQQKQPQMSFFMIWAYGIHDDGSGHATNTDAQIKDTYADPRVVKLADMPGWK